MTPPVCVAVVSWNTRALLHRCLRSLAPAARDGLADVWVVDNASHDGSPDLVREHHPWARLVETGANLGYGAAINLVAERTSSPWIAASNSDVCLAPDALEALLAAGAADPGAGAIAPRLLLPDGATQHSVWPFPTIAATVVMNARRPASSAARLALPGAWDPEVPRRVPWAVGAFLLLRREAFEAAGGFDPAQWMSAEDLDLGWRLHRAGWATRYEPAALVAHDESAATSQLWGGDLPLHWQRCAYAWMVQRRGRTRTVAVGALNLLGAGARFLLGWAIAAGERDEALTALGRWALVHRYAFAPRRILARYR